MFSLDHGWTVGRIETQSLFEFVRSDPMEGGSARSWTLASSLRRGPWTSFQSLSQRRGLDAGRLLQSSIAYEWPSGLVLEAAWQRDDQIGNDLAATLSWEIAF